MLSYKSVAVLQVGFCPISRLLSYKSAAVLQVGCCPTSRLLSYKSVAVLQVWAHMGPNPDRAPTGTGPQPGPGPTSKAICLRIFLDFSGLYGPIRAHMGPYGPGPLKSRKGSEKTHIFVEQHFFSQKSLFLTSRQHFLMEKPCSSGYLAQIRLRTLIKSPQKASSRPNTCKFRTTCTLP